MIQHVIVLLAHGLPYGRRLRDVSYISFDVKKDDSYTGRGRAAMQGGTTRLPLYNRLAVEQKLNTD